MIRELFIPIESVPESYQCGICLELALEPVECRTCEQLFCQCCVNDWKIKKNQCPNRCEGEFSAKPPHRIVRNEIGKLQCYCKNKQHGCEQVLQYEQVIQHSKDCKFKTVQCCPECKWEGLENHLNDHRDKCQFVKTYQCAQCKLDVNKQLKNTHNCIAEMRIEIDQLKQQFESFKINCTQQMQQLVLEFGQQMKPRLELYQDKEAEQKQHKLEQVLQLRQQRQAQQLSQSLQQQQQQQPIIQPVKQGIKLKKPAEYQQTGQLGEQSDNVRCNKGHGLQFWIAPGVNASSQYCDGCMQRQVCRYVCASCESYFCSKCVPPQLRMNSKRIPTHCPGGHVISERNGGGYICDVCSRSNIDMVDQRALQCRQCDFDICHDCMKKNYPLNKECSIQ